jgi:hypothetical protein
MRLRVEEERAAKVIRITLDGKPLALSSVTALDDEEGWVDVALPKTDNLQGAFDEEGKPTDGYEAPTAKFKTKRLKGKVEVLFHD